jgi:GDPmannose 4,6-dehydratase
MLQEKVPDDYVIATGQTASVRDFCRLAFGYVGLDYEEYVRINPAFLRPAEVNVLLGDATKAKQKLSWRATIGLEELAIEMVESDLERLRRDLRTA